MQNLFSMLLVAFMVVLGGIPSLYILIILSGDQICKQDYSDFLRFHKEKGAEFRVMFWLPMEDEVDGY